MADVLTTLYNSAGDPINIRDLERRALGLRKRVLDLSLETGIGHLGGSLSMIEMMVALYDTALQKKDIFILSKGHCCLPYYLMLREQGYNPRISGHPDRDPINGIKCTTGSLGHGLPLGVGMALAKKLKRKSGKVYVLMSDGECEEGTTWESSLLASKYKLDNLVAFVDNNKMQALGFVDDILPLGDLGKKLEAFGWNVREVDGHSFHEIVPALQVRTYQPYAIVAHTTKGKGVSFMENNAEWHAKKPTAERLKGAYEELK